MNDLSPSDLQPAELLRDAFQFHRFPHFLLVLYAIYRVLTLRAQDLFLLITSVFSSWWHIRFLFLIIVSTFLDSICGLIIGEETIPKEQRLAISSWIIVGTFALLVV